MDEMREQLAEYAHTAWADWMSYLLGKLTPQPDGSLVIPAGYVQALQRQIATPYADLTEAEQDSDRREADAMLTIVGARLDAADALRRALDDVRQQWAAGLGDARDALDAALAAYDAATCEASDEG